VSLDSALAISGSDIYTAPARLCEKSFSRRIVGNVVIGRMAMASTVDVLVPGLFVLIERLASRRSGEVPGHANVPQLSPSEGTKMTQSLIGSSEEAGMIALTLVRVIERHSTELATELVTKLGTSPRTTDLRKGRRQIEEILHFELGERRASQGVTLSDFCWAIAVIKEHLWEFLERQGFKRGPVEIYGEVELLRLLDRFLDRALCFATEGDEQPSQLQD
jgi:hypothetical protein